jgi:hypothetical protein
VVFAEKMSKSGHPGYVREQEAAADEPPHVGFQSIKVLEAVHSRAESFE